MDASGSAMFKILVLDVFSGLRLFLCDELFTSVQQNQCFVHLFLRKQVNVIVYLKMKAHAIENLFCLLSKQCQLVASGITL